MLPRGQVIDDPGGLSVKGPFFLSSFFNYLLKIASTKPHVWTKPCRALRSLRPTSRGCGAVVGRGEASGYSILVRALSRRRALWSLCTIGDLFWRFLSGEKNGWSGKNAGSMQTPPATYSKGSLLSPTKENIAEPQLEWVNLSYYLNGSSVSFLASTMHTIV